QGFNPHPNMVFGLPLSVGVTSESEYADFELSYYVEPDEFTKRLNSNLPDGLAVIEAKEKITKSNIMATIAAADYEILVSATNKLEYSYIENIIKDIIEKDSIFVTKESKNSKKEVDIRPMIHVLDAKIMGTSGMDDKNHAVSDREEISNTFLLNYIRDLYKYDSSQLSYDVKNIFCIRAKLSAGSKSNLKPDLLISAFNLLSDMEFKLVKVHRTGLYIEKESRILDPISKDALS
ncbi:MAG: TIGR03936 family radical SAM-associated protein, partial [Bacillota bacterium]|nr:TIGR03936 family radical SAM-associated protein [Bacillota bacterium]